MRTLYFSHSYATADRRFNEHIWNLLMKERFHALIDTGLDGGWHGNRRPMEISFNEWMLSCCVGFVAVVPRRASPYQALEYRLALRMGLPTLVFMQEGGELGAIYTKAHEFPPSWQRFWQEDNQKRLAGAIKEFAKSVEIYVQARAELSIVGSWLPRSGGGSLSIAFLQPTEEAWEWFEVQRQLQTQTNHKWLLYTPNNLPHAHDLILETSRETDLLVLDVGPRGTPRELVGYLDGIGIPQFRVCKVQDQLEADELGKHLSGKPRLPYRMHNDSKTLPLFLDGLKLDEGMEPVFFWQSKAQLVERLKSLTDRIKEFRSGIPPDEGGTKIELDSLQSAKQYFTKRYQENGRGYVFLSFAGGGGATKLTDRLAPILRFLDCRCFHYRDSDSNTVGRLESGEPVRAGLGLRVEGADVVVLLIDQAYLDSPYCRDEMRQAVQLYSQGRLEIRAYALDTRLEFPNEMDDINIFKHRGDWSDETLEQRIVEDIQQSLNARRWPLREEERRKLSEWLTEDDQNNAKAVRRLLMQSGVKERELDSLEFDWSRDNWFDAFLSLPEKPEKRGRARSLIGLLILAVTEDKPDRRRSASIWLRRQRLLGFARRLVAPNEDVVAIDPKQTLVGLTIKSSDHVSVGQSLRESFPDVLNSRRRLVLDAEPRNLEVPIEWTRENAEAEPIAVRRPICWRLPFVETRKCLFDDLSAGGLPPAVLILALDASDISPQKEGRVLKDLLDKIYINYSWPPEMVRWVVCKDVRELETRIINCKEQVVHVSGHMGSEGLQVPSEIFIAEQVAKALSSSDVRLMVLNGCDGGTPRSPLAFEYATLAERLVRDGKVPEIVAHRGPLREDDSLAFARKFHESFFFHFDPAQAALEARKEGSEALRLSPIVISQRGKGTT